MYTSVKDVMKTAIPESYKEAMQTNPVSLHKAFKSHPPAWYSSLPSDVKSFMESNRKAAVSIREKDVGTLSGATATDKKGKHAKSTAAADHEDGEKNEKGKDKKGKKSEASSLGLVGATVGTLAGAFGVAMLLL
jgi:hypothetical protein